MIYDDSKRINMDMIEIYPAMPALILFSDIIPKLFIVAPMPNTMTGKKDSILFSAMPYTDYFLIIYI